jgi:hypothetical protein
VQTIPQPRLIIHTRSKRNRYCHAVTFHLVCSNSRAAWPLLYQSSPAIFCCTVYLFPIYAHLESWLANSDQRAIYLLGDDPKHQDHMLYSTDISLQLRNELGSWSRARPVQVNSRGSGRGLCVREGGGGGVMRVEAHIAKPPLELPENNNLIIFAQLRYL